MNTPALCTDQDIVEFISDRQGKAFSLTMGADNGLEVHKLVQEYLVKMGVQVRRLLVQGRFVPLVAKVEIVN